MAGQRKGLSESTLNAVKSDVMDAIDSAKVDNSSKKESPSGKGCKGKRTQAKFSSTRASIKNCSRKGQRL